MVKTLDLLCWQLSTRNCKWQTPCDTVHARGCRTITECTPAKLHIRQMPTFSTQDSAKSCRNSSQLHLPCQVVLKHTSDASWVPCRAKPMQFVICQQQQHRLCSSCNRRPTTPQPACQMVSSHHFELKASAVLLQGAEVPDARLVAGLNIVTSWSSRCARWQALVCRFVIRSKHYNPLNDSYALLLSGTRIMFAQGSLLRPKRIGLYTA